MEQITKVRYDKMKKKLILWYPEWSEKTINELLNTYFEVKDS